MTDPDYLAPLSAQQVAAWYGRLADRWGQERIDNQQPLAPLFLRHWLDNRDSTSVFQFQAPNYLRSSPYVSSVLRYQRRVFLTEEQARLTGGRRIWAGVLPRMRGSPGFTRWDLRVPVNMEYESLVEVGSNAADIARIQLSGSNAEKDLFGSLRGFQLRSHVLVSGARLPGASVRMAFLAWSCRVSDRYDFDYREHLTVPNPDYGIARPDAIRPQDRSLKVYHANARRLEQAGLAAPYNIVSKEWHVSDASVLKPGEVDPTRRL